MSSLECLWCETRLKPGTDICPDCHLQNPAANPTSASASPSRRGRRIALALIAVPFMFSVAYAASTTGLPFLSSASGSAGMVATAAVTPLQPPAVYSDPLRRSVWADGVKSVQQALAQPGYAGFSNSYINVAAGHVVSFCGEVAGTSGYDSASGSQRFVSIFGQAQSTLVEGNDPSFEVLWNRACGVGANSAES